VNSETIGVIGLGYVGLPLALAFARKGFEVIGYDHDPARIEGLRRGHDRNGETTLTGHELHFTNHAGDLVCTFFVVAVPTPVDVNHAPDLQALRDACSTVGHRLKPGDVVVFESTVYPGVTEDICGPALVAASGLPRSAFTLGYSPERINPGDTVHRLETIVKVVSGEDAATLDRVAGVYGAIIEAGVHRAPSIRVAEAAKVIENTQRDLNIALVNELAIIFDRMGLRTADVLAAAATKWNALPFRPGLVGGHCIGVDPYYLTAAAQKLGYQPEVILAGRRINNAMGPFLAAKTVKLLAECGIAAKWARVAVLGLTFKEDCHDIRNSRVPDIVRELREFGCDVTVHDPLADPNAATRVYGIDLASSFKSVEINGPYDAVILAVGHAAYKCTTRMAYLARGGVLVDVKSICNPAMVAAIEPRVRYWSL
jgi:UDP-N-acetyl-D-galactosamine dehydrogenase